MPIYCAHPKMEPVAVCRMCLVQIEKMPKLQPACSTYVATDMVVQDRNRAGAQDQRGNLEFLLLNHPLDCPVCDRGGECDLQDFTVRYGPGKTGTRSPRRSTSTRRSSSPTRSCSTRSAASSAGAASATTRRSPASRRSCSSSGGSTPWSTTFNGQPLKVRVPGQPPRDLPGRRADPHQVPVRSPGPGTCGGPQSVCPKCSYGCNINIDTRDFQVKRFARGDNPLVDDMWLCDRGRYSFPRWNSTERIRRPMVRRRGEVAESRTLQEAVAAAAEQLSAVKEQRRRRVDRRPGLARDHQRRALSAAAAGPRGGGHASPRPPAGELPRPHRRRARPGDRRDRGVSGGLGPRCRAGATGAGAHAPSLQGGDQEGGQGPPPRPRRRPSRRARRGGGRRATGGGHRRRDQSHPGGVRGGRAAASGATAKVLTIVDGMNARGCQGPRDCSPVCSPATDRRQAAGKAGREILEAAGSRSDQGSGHGNAAALVTRSATRSFEQALAGSRWWSASGAPSRARSRETATVLLPGPNHRGEGGHGHQLPRAGCSGSGPPSSPATRSPPGPDAERCWPRLWAHWGLGGRADRGASRLIGQAPSPPTRAPARAAGPCSPRRRRERLDRHAGRLVRLPHGGDSVALVKGVLIVFVCWPPGSPT